MDTESNIQVTGKYQQCIQYYYGISFYLQYYFLFSSVSVAHGHSCMHQNSIPRSALQFIIDTSEKTGEVLVTGVAHPCRTGISANNLTAAEVEAFFESCVKQMVFC